MTHLRNHLALRLDSGNLSEALCFRRLAVSGDLKNNLRSCVGKHWSSPHCKVKRSLHKWTVELSRCKQWLQAWFTLVGWVIDRLSRTTSTRFLHLKCSYTNLLGNVAQSAEQRTVNPWAIGSYPTISAISTYWGSDAYLTCHPQEMTAKAVDPQPQGGTSFIS